MTFEEILPGLKAKKKYVRTGWGGAENYVQLFDTIEQNGVALEVTPYFLINVSGEGEGFSMWSPTPCDVLATDWVEVHDQKGLDYRREFRDWSGSSSPLSREGLPGLWGGPGSESPVSR